MSLTNTRVVITVVAFTLVNQQMFTLGNFASFPVRPRNYSSSFDYNTTTNVLPRYHFILDVCVRLALPCTARFRFSLWHAMHSRLKISQERQHLHNLTHLLIQY